MKKRFLAGLLAAMIVVSMMTSTAIAQETTNDRLDENTAVQHELTLRIVTQEEMDNILSNIQAGTIPMNWFEDIVLVSGKRVVKSDGTEYFSLTLVNAGFVFDRVDVDGEIWLYDMGARIVTHKYINEDKIIYGISRKIDIHPIGGHYATGHYRLRLSDGDIGTTYEGSISEFGG